MTKVIVNNLNSIYSYKERIFKILVVGIAICALSYAYLLHGAIKNVVEREKISKASQTISGKINELESNYFAIKNTVDIELAHAKGFKDGEISTFISKKSLTAMANHNEL
jgi:hypothetical protein